MSDIKALLAEGIRALKAGQKERACELLTQVVTEDEENEPAWLWLSGAVDSDEDRRICLENVIAINPDNQAARKGLARLGPAPMQFAEDEPLPIVIAKSAAKSDAPFLPPPEEKPVAGEPEARIIKGSERPLLDDVWSSTVDICAYCAQAVNSKDNHCPQCKRAMMAKEFLYPAPSKYHMNLLIVIGILTALSIIGTGLLIYVFAIVPPEILAPSVPESISVEAFRISYIAGLVIGITLNLVILAGLYTRQIWAYWLTVVVYVVGLLWTVLSLSITFRLLPPVWFFTCATPFLLYYLFIFYTIHMAGPDFKKVVRWQVVNVNSRLKESEEFDRVAGELAKQGKWAAAVAHWRHAAGHSPGQWKYLRPLAQGYARLGFYQRSLESLATALEAARNPQVREAISEEIRKVEKKMGTTGAVNAALT
jgi:tetratricopeptide (TPR) repeat protein